MFCSFEKSGFIFSYGLSQLVGLLLSIKPSHERVAESPLWEQVRES